MTVQFVWIFFLKSELVINKYIAPPDSCDRRLLLKLCKRVSGIAHTCMAFTRVMQSQLTGELFAPQTIAKRDTTFQFSVLNAFGRRVHFAMFRRKIERFSAQ